METIEGAEIKTNKDGLIAMLNQLMGKDNTEFEVGSCKGVFFTDDKYFNILAIENKEPHNGDFEKAMKWFYIEANKSNLGVRFCELLNTRFKLHLITKKGFFEDKTEAEKQVFGYVAINREEARKRAIKITGEANGRIMGN